MLRKRVIISAIVIMILVALGGSQPVSASDPDQDIHLMHQNVYQPIAEFLRPDIPNMQVTSVEVYGINLYITTHSPNRLYHFKIAELPGLESFTTYTEPESFIEIESIIEGGSRYARGLLNAGNVLYVYGNIGLQIFSLEEPNNPTLLEKLPFYPRNLIQYQDYLIALGSQRIEIFSIVDPASPEHLSTLNTPGLSNFSAAVFNQRLYVSGFVSGEVGSTISIYDFSDPENITLVDRLDFDLELRYHLFIFRNKLVGCGTEDVVLWSLSHPENPSLEDTQPTQARTCQLLGNGDLVTNGDVFSVVGDSLQIRINMDDVFRYTFDGFPYGAAAAGGYVFLAQSPRVVAIRAPYFTYLPLILK